MGIKSTNWLEETLKPGQIKIQAAKERTDKSPDMEGVLKLADGTICQVSLWKVRIGEGRYIATGTFESKDVIKNRIRTNPKYQNAPKTDLSDFLPSD